MSEHTPPGAPGSTADVGAEAAVRAERQRSAEIRKRVRALNLGDDLAETLIDEGLSVDQAATRMVDALAKRSPTVPAAPAGQGGGNDDPKAIRDAMADAIAVRVKPGFKTESDRFRVYANWRPTDMAAELMRMRGEAVDPRNRVDIAQRAFGGSHTTGDFPLLLAAAANKVLMADYQAAAPTYRRFMQRKTFTDFKVNNMLRPGDFPALQAYGEGGEIKFGTISESKETMTLGSYGRRIRVTRQMLINDDLGAFSDWAGMIGRRVAEFENSTAYAVVNSNSGNGPTLNTGNAAVFGTTTTAGATYRANKAASGTDIDITNLGAGRAAMMKQTSLDGIPLNIMPAYLLTGPDKFTTAQQITASVQPVINSAVNPFSGRLEPIADANITGNRWYLFADPASAPVYAYGYLSGAEQPQVTVGNQMGFDGTEIQVILDFAVGAIDFRGGWFNPGT